MRMKDTEFSVQAKREEMSQVAFGAAIGAALMLYVGFGMNLSGISDSALYNGSVAAFTWTMKIGGALMGLSALLLYLGWEPSLFFDAILTGVVGVVLIGSGGVWMLHQDMQGILSLIFGAMFLVSARRSWLLYIAASPAGSVASPLPGHDESDHQPPASSPRVGEDRRAAVERLLAAKRQEKELISAEPIPDVQRAAPDAASEPPPDVPRPDEPAPEGFLAELGKPDQRRE